MGRKRNTFSKAVKHLKSSRIDEKLQTLNEIPTMNTSGIYDTVPGALSRTEVDKNNPTIPDYSGIDWDVDGGDGKDTSGLFDSEGNSLFVTPPGDNSYILGPMASMFYNYSYSSDWTMIGYIREADRRFVNLGYIQSNSGTGFNGRLEDWDGVNHFYSYGSLTLEQALWFRDTPKKGGTGASGHESSDFRAFYPGPPSSTPDAFGRYYCTITGTPKATTSNTRTVAPMDMQGSDNFSAIADLNKNVRAVYKGGKLVYDRYPTIDPEGAAYLRKKAKEHGLSVERAEEMLADDPGELLKFVQMQDSLQADIDRYGAEEKAARKEMRNIAIELGVDVALTLFGGAIIKGTAKGIAVGAKALRNANRAKNIAKAADAAVDASKINKAVKAAKTGKLVRPTNHNITGVKNIKTPPKVKGKFNVNVKDAKGNVIAKNYKGADGKWYQVPNPYKGKGSGNKMKDLADKLKWEIGERQVSGSQVRNWEKTGEPLKGWRPDRLFTDPFGPGSTFSGPTSGAKILTDPLTKAFKPVSNTIKSVTNSPLGKALTKEIGNSSLVKVAPHIAKASAEGAKPITRAVASKTIQQLVGTSTDESGTETASKVLNVVTSVLPSNIKSPAKIFLGYLTGTIEGNAGDAIDADDQTAAWKNLNIDPSSNSLNVGGHMSNVFGGEPLSHLTVKDGNAVLKFNFAPTKNEDEFASHPGKYSPTQQKILKMLGPYSADLNIQIPGGPWTAPISGATGPLASLATVMAKGLDKITPDDSILGGIKTGRSLTGDIKIPLEKLKELKPDVYKYLTLNKKESYAFCSNINLSEDRKSTILKTLKDPVVLPESKKKHKVKPGQRYKGKTNFQGMDKLIGDIKPQEPFKKERTAWSKDWQGYNARLSQEKKNEVLELVGDGKHAFDYMLNDSKIKNAKEMEKFWGLHPELYSYIFNGKKYKATRKEQVRGDYIVFLIDENGEKTSMLQSDISIKLSEEHEKEMLAEYNKTNEPTPFLKDPLMKKVAKRLKNEIDYPDRPAKKGYPNEPPPKQVDGWHPEYGKKYKYDKLDPVSAVMMKRAPTGDPEIDANVEKAARKPKVKVKEEISDWRNEIES